MAKKPYSTTKLQFTLNELKLIERVLLDQAHFFDDLAKIRNDAGDSEKAKSYLVDAALYREVAVKFKNAQAGLE